MLLEPKEIEVNGKYFTISKFPAVIGREIMCKYPLSSVPKFGDYSVNEETMFKLMKHVAVKIEGNKEFILSTRELIDNHVIGFEMLMKLELAVMEYNCSFFQNGLISSFFADFAQKLPAWISKILMGFSEQLSQREKPVSTN